MSLLSKAKSVQRTKNREISEISKEEIELLFAYINSEIDTYQVASVLKCSQPNAYNKLCCLAMKYLKSTVLK